MPDRAAAERRRAKHGGAAQNAAAPLSGLDRFPGEWPDGPADRPSSPHPLGIPRILGRRARWVGARLRREP
ncbi:hypothetical protein [Kitasatospora viridis]|nr:hypothetical protein [Kitasatospora viridis]